MPTPLSDGKRVYVWCNMGVAACYDLEGRRQWIRRLETGPIAYGSSPALADGVFGVFLNQLHGLDAETGELRWTQPRVHKNIAAVLAARMAGQNVFVTQPGEVIQPSDGRLLFRPSGIVSGDQGWSPPVILGDTMYSQRYGVTEINVYDFTGCEGDTWRPKKVATINLPGEVSRKPDGGWIDRWTAGSPLVWEGLLYQVDIYGSLYVVDLAAKEMVYRRDLNLRGFMHYNSVPVAASPALIGRHIYVMDNQGTTLVLEPGREFKVAARNQLDTQLERHWPIPAQETIAYAPPITDGNRLYLRGERYLYCLGDQRFNGKE
ncbi:MAG: PQQ-binding-like beta-propeller repeat protein [Planctomycetes bacterium]|nr:PQQ-binding-like beta-propeller repeat protein [Planctomycetota bacterium]